jgi:hypothetical protein
MGWTVHGSQGHLAQRMLRHYREVLQTDTSGLEMKRYGSDPGSLCILEYMWIGHTVGPLAGASVIMSIPVLVLISRWRIAYVPCFALLHRY